LGLECRRHDRAHHRACRADARCPAALRSAGAPVPGHGAPWRLGHALMPRLSELFPEADTRMVVGLSADSREVKPGFVFVAMPGARANGLDYVPAALASGAVAIVAEAKPAGLPEKIAFLPVTNARLALAQAAA